MRTFLILIIFLINIAFCAELDLNNFEQRQKILQDIRTIVQYEESIARAYEEYILNNYDIPDDMTLLYTDIYLGAKSDFLKLFSTNNISLYINDFTIDKTKISYALKETLLGDFEIKKLYESNTFRKRTYLKNGEINFVLEDSFAKHLYDLIVENNSKLINPCTSIYPNKNCILNNHIYIKPTYAGGVLDKSLMYYHIDKFKTGPIIITDDTSKYSTESEFSSISKGAILYDINGVKYVKTISAIELLK